MEVKSKFNKGDTIFFMVKDKPHQRQITGISFFNGKATSINGEQKLAETTQVRYHTEGCFEVAEQKSFASKEELIKSVFNHVDNGEYSPFEAPVKAPASISKN